MKVLDKCVGCGICVVFCKRRAIRTYGRAIIDKDKCNNCGICVKYCPINAIVLGE
ncbi:ferredoxin [Methanocaldococcus villosus KIN24-T80]|uniref:Ferredoxin n=1 Tax=Methanocaldococcus villosus KIN24-T80 TaxID=1069083 RepID=N6VQ98_9EURY|nr:4Fe-4S binding protein [Methanocaldococcus villosus]ENN96055.1 ferredoxin [Methanocaldococcus villosus KIN24-T80]